MLIGNYHHEWSDTGSQNMSTDLLLPIIIVLIVIMET